MLLIYNQNQLNKRENNLNGKEQVATATPASVDLKIESVESNTNGISQTTSTTTTAASSTTTAEASSKEWCDDEVRLLVKGVKIIPVGTRDRWDVIANFIEEHSRGKFKRTGKEVLNKTKDLQKMGAKQKFHLFF